MNRKLLFHLCMLVALGCLAMIIWTNLGGEETPVRSINELTDEELDLAIDEGRIVENLVGELEWADSEKSGVGESGRILVGIAMLVVVAGYGAIVFVAYLLPDLVHRFTHMFYGSAEEAETDPMHDARALFAQGEFHAAIEAYRGVAAEQPENRFPWIEIAKIQHDNLEDPDAAIQTLRQALESYEWRVNDAAFFMFRLAELYENDKGDFTTSVGILQQVVELFPETRHSANATHKLRELGAI